MNAAVESVLSAVGAVSGATGVVLRRPGVSGVVSDIGEEEGEGDDRMDVDGDQGGPGELSFSLCFSFRFVLDSATVFSFSWFGRFGAFFLCKLRTVILGLVGGLSLG